MSSIKCPECSKTISSKAEACPGCGYPLSSASSSRAVLSESESGTGASVPMWAIAPAVILGVVVLFGLIYMIQNNDEPVDENINISVAKERSRNSADARSKRTPETIVPDGTDKTIVETRKEAENDQTLAADTKTQVRDNQEEKGSVKINARVSDSKGKITPVEEEKFYLLDKKLGDILTDAKLKPIENLDLKNSFGLSVLSPEKYPEFNKKALAAINNHVKYDALSGSNGMAQMNEIEPGEYFLFAIHKVGNGFAIWSSKVDIKPGNNTLNIKPERLNELKG
ncbi:MAG: zinc ribbon domain-containing protein [Pyrinomonadaceae bacterium]|nr:zinc ribbon domain-containing protein [Pyrinomonadaceae bacterium]